MFLEVKITEKNNTFKLICDEYKIEYSRGCGYYKLLEKKENISQNKKLIIVDRNAVNNKPVYIDKNVYDILNLSKDFKSLKISKNDIPQQYDVFVNSTSANRKLMVDSTCLIDISNQDILPAWNNMIIYRKDDIAVIPSESSGMLSLRDRCKNIRNIFKKFGGEVIDKPFNFQYNIKELDELYALGPFEFNGLSLRGNGFSGIEDEYNQEEVVDCLFGDEMGKNEFLKKNPSPNVAEDDWKWFCSFMEYHHYFVNVNDGSVRLFTSNTPEDEHTCDGPFEIFFGVFENYTKEVERLYDKFLATTEFPEEDKDMDLFEEWVGEECSFMEYLENNLPKKRQKVAINY